MTTREHALGEGVEDHADVDDEAGEGAVGGEGDPVPGGGWGDAAGVDAEGDEEADGGGADGGEDSHVGLAPQVDEDGDGGREGRDEEEPGEIHGAGQVGSEELRTKNVEWEAG